MNVVLVEALIAPALGEILTEWARTHPMEAGAIFAEFDVGATDTCPPAGGGSASVAGDGRIDACEVLASPRGRAAPRWPRHHYPRRRTV